MANLAECRDRIGWCGYAWGLLLGSMVMQLRGSMWRRLAGCVTITHLGGSYASYTSIDRVFDKVYPFFVEDLRQYKKEQQETNKLKRNKADKESEDERLKQFFKEYYKK